MRDKILIYVLMMNILQVEIKQLDPHNNGHFKTLFRTEFELDSSLRFDYQRLIDGITLLFSNKKDLCIHLNLM